MSRKPDTRRRAVDPKRLIELLRIAQHGSYTKAAEVQGVSQPALSRSMSIFEHSLSVRLLNRTRHGAELTDFGTHLVVYAQALESLLERAAEDIHLKKLGLRGSVVIGVSPVACSSLVPEAVVRSKSTSPEVAISVLEGPDDWLLAKLRSGEIDLMVSPAGFLSEPSDVQREILLLDSFIVVARAGSDWTMLQDATLASLRDAHWVMPNSDSVMWRHVQSLFAAHNIAWPENCITSNSISTLKSILMRSDCVTMTSRELIWPELENGTFAVVGMPQLGSPREICLRTRREAGLSAPATRIIENLRQVASERRDQELKPPTLGRLGSRTPKNVRRSRSKVGTAN